MGLVRRWRWGALAVVVLGVPLWMSACGGRTLEGGGSGGDPGGATASPGAMSGAVSNPATATSLGPFPCTAYTAAYESCPPAASAGGCPYVSEWGSPPQGLTTSTSERA